MSTISLRSYLRGQTSGSEQTLGDHFPGGHQKRAGKEKFVFVIADESMTKQICTVTQKYKL